MPTFIQNWINVKIIWASPSESRIFLLKVIKLHQWLKMLPYLTTVLYRMRICQPGWWEVLPSSFYVIFFLKISLLFSNNKEKKYNLKDHINTVPAANIGESLVNYSSLHICLSQTIFHFLPTPQVKNGRKHVVFLPLCCFPWLLPAWLLVWHCWLSLRWVKSIKKVCAIWQLGNIWK